VMHVVLGDGEMSRRELSSTLEDLLEKAGDEDFWFLVQAKSEPTATDKAMMEWIAERGVYYESIGDDPKAADPIYKDAQEKHTVKRLAPKVLSLMQEKPQEGEGAALFALFVNNDDEVEEDRWLMDVATTVADAPEKFVVYAMNDGLAELGFDEEGGEEEPAEEPEPEPAPAPTKAVAKKAAPKPRPADDDEGEPAGDVDIANDVLTRDALEEMTLPQLKEIAAARGVELPPRTRAQTYISVLLGEGDEEAVAVIEEVEVPELPEGDDEDIAFEAEAMVVVIFNGTIMARTMSVEEARTIAAGV
jgi:hypothetical protein